MPASSSRAINRRVWYSVGAGLLIVVIIIAIVVPISLRDDDDDDKGSKVKEDTQNMGSLKP